MQFKQKTCIILVFFKEEIFQIITFGRILQQLDINFRYILTNVGAFEYLIWQRVHTIGLFVLISNQYHVKQHLMRKKQCNNSATLSVRSFQKKEITSFAKINIIRLNPTTRIYYRIKLTDFMSLNIVFNRYSTSIV